MKKFYFLLFWLTSMMVVNAQVGINTSEPKATLEIKAETNGATKVEGLLIPSLTKSEINNMNVTDEHKGLMIYNATENCIQAYTNNQWDCIGGGVGTTGGLNQYLNVVYAGSTGVWVENYSANGNTISFSIGNNSSTGFSQLNFNNALSLVNASGGLSYTPSADYSNVTIAAGTTAVFTYNITGTPTNSGTLTANFNAPGNLSAYGNVDIEQKSGVRALSLSFSGDYITNKQLDASNHSVSLTVRNFSLNPLSNADLSDIVSFSGVSGVTILPNQNTNVTIQPNEEIVLTYSLSGLITQVGTLTAQLEPNVKVSGNVSASKQITLFSNATSSNMNITGSYVYGQAMSPSNTIVLTLTNNNAFDLQQIDLSDAITLSGATNNLTVESNQNTAVDIPANASISLTYNLTGTSLVQAGGTLTADFSQTPFTDLTATANVIGNNSFYVTPNTQIYSDQGGNTVFNVQSSEAWTYEILGDATNWITVTATTGTSGNGSISVQTSPKTSQYAKIGYIKVRQTPTGAERLININQPPTDEFEITSTNNGLNLGLYYYYQVFDGDFGPELSSSLNYLQKTDRVISKHSTRQATWITNQSNLQVYGDLPEFIESVSFNGNQIIITPKERTSPGKILRGDIRFSYGNGYLTLSIPIYQMPSAQKCPASSPIRPDNGYRIWNSGQTISVNDLATLIEARATGNQFTDYQIDSEYKRVMNINYNPLKKVIEEDATSSYLYVRPNESQLSSLVSLNYDEPESYKSKYLFFFNRNKSLGAYANNVVNPDYTEQSLPDMSQLIVISPVFCADGWDEDTPNTSGNAGWRTP